MDETGEVVVDIEGNIESGKTAQDYENEINNYLVEATQAAAAKNWKKSEAILVRACTVTARFFGGNSLQLASVLSKLAASQEMLGKSTNSKLTWERALFIWEINRTKRRSANGRAKKQERDASIIGTHSKEPKYRNYCSHTHSAVRQFSLEEIFVCPHHTMQYVDGCILYGHRISMENLTPRTRKVLRDRNVDPNILRIRDFHSFFLAHPTLPTEDRQKFFVRWAQRREILIRELREDMETLRLKIESEERMKLMEMKVILEKEARKARFLGLSKVKKGSTSNSIPKSVMPTRPDHKFRGKYLESRRNINFAAILATN
jgi:hypothetical protein